jgi:predicted O-methyltransferase YrrM
VIDMKPEEWTPGTLLETAGSYWASCTLHAGIELDIFSIIGDGELMGDQVAEKLQADHRATSMLLNALAAMSLLVKRGEVYGNTPVGKEYLTKDSPQYLGHIIQHHHYLVESWSKLDQAVKAGQPVRHRAVISDDAKREAFLMGMFNIAMAMAPKVVNELDLAERKRLLDLGGGPGTYAIHFCKRYPKLKATVCDLATTRPFAEKTIARFGLSDRIDFVELDYLSQNVTGTYDVAWLSFILHGEGPDDCHMIVQKAVRALAPGGLIAIQEFVLENTMDGPLHPALFSLNMLLGTARGQSYSEEQIIGMLADNDVGDIRRTPLMGPTESSIIVGKKLVRS